MPLKSFHFPKEGFLVQRAVGLAMRISLQVVVSLTEQLPMKIRCWMSRNLRQRHQMRAWVDR
jgi:hypothetical protein